MIVGLGNPGAEYEGTRHNTGFWLADALVARWRLPRWDRYGNARATGGRIPAGQVHVMKPQTYMNLSGRVLRDLRVATTDEPLPDLLILVDDFALPVGTFRIRSGGSAGGHNGLKSIEAALNTKNYPRLRIGVGPKPRFVDQAEFVLDAMPPEERKLVDELMPEMGDAVEMWVAEGAERTMARYNRKTAAADSDE